LSIPYAYLPYRGAETDKQGASHPSDEDLSPGTPVGSEGTSKPEAVPARGQFGWKKAEKGLKRVDFTPKLLVFSTRLSGNFVDGKRVKCTLHQTKCSFFHSMRLFGLRNDDPEQVGDSQ
jgi:hypothetical protein